MTLKSLKVKSELAPNPTTEPLFFQAIKNAKGEEVKVADPAMIRALIALMNYHAVSGGAACHWGGPAALCEINSALHSIMFSTSTDWREDFNFVNDVGHGENGIYALRALHNFDQLTFNDLKGFRSIESKLTGHGESHLNPQGVLLSNGPLGSSVPQAQGLALADKLLGNDRVTINIVSDGASMEGEAKEAFSAIPGLAKRERLAPFVAIISDNNTKLSGRINQDAFSMDGYFDSLEAQGWNVIKLENPYDLQKTYSTLEKAIELAKTNPTHPVCIHAKTIKGYGVKKTEEASSGGHGYPIKKDDPNLRSFVAEILNQNIPEVIENWLQDIESTFKKESSASSGVKKEKAQAGFAKALDRAVKEGLPVYSISADLQGSTGAAGFHKDHPDRYTEVGVAESNMISVAAGLSKNGLIPIVDTFSQFGVTKGNLPLTMAALSQAGVIALFSHTGFQDAADGASHQATTYFSAVSSLPHTEVINVSTSKDAEEFLYQAIKEYAHALENNKDPKNYIFFVGRENFIPEFENVKYEWGKAQIIHEDENPDVVITSCGPLAHKLHDVKNEFHQNGLKIIAINNPFINSIDTQTFKEALSKTNGKMITLEDHQQIGGMGSLLFAKLINEGIELKGVNIGIDGRFGRSAYLADHLYDYYGLNATNVLKAYNEKLKQR